MVASIIIFYAREEGTCIYVYSLCILLQKIRDCMTKIHVLLVPGAISKLCIKAMRNENPSMKAPFNLPYFLLHSFYSQQSRSLKLVPAVTTRTSLTVVHVSDLNMYQYHGQICKFFCKFSKLCIEIDRYSHCKKVCQRWAVCTGKKVHHLDQNFSLSRLVQVSFWFDAHKKMLWLAIFHTR